MFYREDPDARFRWSFLITERRVGFLLLLNCTWPADEDEAASASRTKKYRQASSMLSAVSATCKKSKSETLPKIVANVPWANPIVTVHEKSQNRICWQECTRVTTRGTHTLLFRICAFVGDIKLVPLGTHDTVADALTESRVAIKTNKTTTRKAQGMLLTSIGFYLRRWKSELRNWSTWTNLWRSWLKKLRLDSNFCFLNCRSPLCIKLHARVLVSWNHFWENQDTRVFVISDNKSREPWWCVGIISEKIDLRSHFWANRSHKMMSGVRGDYRFWKDSSQNARHFV